MKREATKSRTTNETSITVSLCLDGTGTAQIRTGIGFMDHMLDAVARHGFFDLTIQAQGDLGVDAHHTMEDLGLVLGEALRAALGDRHGIRRYGSAMVPMDESLARVVIDLSGRPCLAYDVKPEPPEVGGISARLYREFFQALVNNAGLTLHIAMLSGEEGHHMLEAVFKAFGRALDAAAACDPRRQGPPSTKGTLG